MIYLYLDESGDLGFDFFAKKPSSFFTVAILSVNGVDNNRALINAVKKTIRRKLPKNSLSELKGSHSSIEIKKYFYEQLANIPFEIYAITLNKRRVYNDLAQKKDRLYNFVARLVLDHIPLESASTRVQFIIDKSKDKKGIGDFNSYVVSQLEGRIDPKVPLDIYHHRSHENLGIQATDLFSWGICRSYEKDDFEWFNVFRERVRYNGRYL